MNPAGKLLAALLLVTGSSAATAETATLARDTTLHEKPLGNAAVVGTLKAQSLVTVDARKGAWAKVTTTDGKTGHLRILNLRSTSTQKGDSGVSALASVFRTGSSGSSVATGVKGMSAEELTGAAPNEAELQKLQGLRVSEDEARRSAGRAGLKPVDVAELPAPARR